MAIDYLMPKLAMAMNEGTVNEWLASEGEYVEQGQLLATVETEKVSYDVESPDAGYLHIIVPAGETVDCEVLLAQFAADESELQQLQAGSPSNATVPPDTGAVAAAPPEPQGQPVSPKQGRIKASPLARKMAAAAGLDLEQLNGSGPGGRIVKRDILAAGQEAALRPIPASGDEQVLARLPMQGMRKTIAARMTQSLQETAQLSSSWESDIEELLALRQSFVEREEQLGTRVSFNAFLIKAVVYAIRRVPIANSCLLDDEIVIYNNVNMGIAVSVPGSSAYDSGLMVAVLHNVDRMGLVEIDLQMKALIDRVRNGQATPEDLSGSTFTLSSTAGIAPPGLKTTPVLNQPNTALLGPSTPVQRPVAKEGEVVVRTQLPLSFTFDHRILDGEPAARWMSALHECLENPGLMLA